jgi:glycerate kinase
VTPITRTSSTLIPQRLLLAIEPFGPRLSVPRVADAIARGLQEGGAPEPDTCPLPLPGSGEDIRVLLDTLDFDARMRRARAVVVGAKRLEEPMLAGRSLIGSATFEIATRARQGGVPAYAVTAENALYPFDARILDLQVIVEASSLRALVAVGRKLAQMV